MKQNYISKILGGLTIMFSIFLFFAAAKQLTYQNEQILANVTGGTNKANLVQQENKEIDNGIITGNFNVESDGNVRYSYDEKETIKFYYKAVRSDKLKNDKLQPVLKLEQVEGEGKVWKETAWSWIDYDQGVLYFHFQTEENGIKEKVAYFTGKYQIILNN